MKSEVVRYSEPYYIYNSISVRHRETHFPQVSMLVPTLYPTWTWNDIRHSFVRSGHAVCFLMLIFTVLIWKWETLRLLWTNKFVKRLMEITYIQAHCDVPDTLVFYIYISRVMFVDYNLLSLRNLNIFFILIAVCKNIQQPIWVSLYDSWFV
jgi:hypothetical protein